MYGDYSRGHEPDRKRGRIYRRVLLQMGRPVLDSDFASMVDSVLGQVLETARGLGCSAASPDLGFLVTPGRLLCLFAEDQDALEVTEGTPDAWIDYRFRLAGRYPALYVGAGTAQARVTVPGVQPADASGPARAALWVQVEDGVTIEVNGVPVALSPESPNGIQRVEFDTGGASLSPVEITVPVGGEVWLYLLEQDEAAGGECAFWIAPGTYHTDGLIARTEGGRFPPVSFPESAGFPWSESPDPGPPLDGILAPDGVASGDRLVAYLETWERHITSVEDPGIREEALGPLDTSARSELVGQVKLGTIAGPTPSEDEAAESIRRAFHSVEVSGGQLTVGVPSSTPTTDPCALPDLSGYSGSDNRLYRMEVHRGGGLAQVVFKWSRDNGSELFAARLDTPSGNLVFDAGTALTAGDIVEVLSSVVDLGDDVRAQVDAAGFVPAERAVGQLAQLAAVQVASSSDEVVFRLVDPDDITIPVVLDDRYGTIEGSGLKLRRWHGLLNPQLTAGGGPASPGPHVLEDGISVELSSTGSYRPAQFWQYEARVRSANANGPWRSSPHGPERRFAPLALLEFQGAGQPLRLVAWLDERFSHPCDLDADEVSFAGDRVGSSSDTVQEALEELFERPPEIVDASCGELIIRPENDLQAVFDTILDGQDRRICIHPGTWRVDQTVLVEDKGSLVISGAGAATLLTGNVDSVLRFQGCGTIRIQDLRVEGGQVGVVGDGQAGSISAINCTGLDLQRVDVSCGDALSRRMSAVEMRSDFPDQNQPEVRIHDCRVEAGHAQVGILIVNASSVDVEGNTVLSPQREQPLIKALAEPEVGGRIGNTLIGNVYVGETEEANDELLVGSPDILIEVDSPQDGRRRFIAHLEEWGYEFITFTSELDMSNGQWLGLLVANPIVGATGDSMGEGFVAGQVRNFRRELVQNMFGLSTSIQMQPGIRAMLTNLANTMSAQNSFTAGGQGIVLGGRGTPIDTDFPQPRVLTAGHRPDARIHGNRVLGFTQGIHIGTSTSNSRGISYRVNVEDNVVHSRVPGLARDPHGIFVGSVFHLSLRGNSVELVTPGPVEWPTAPPMTGLEIHGTFGPQIQVRENSCAGPRTGFDAHATNPAEVSNEVWRWALNDNAYVGPPGGVFEQRNW